MGMIKTKDGVEIFYKDWGKGQPIVFSHGWPLSADDWDNQMLFFLSRGYRVIAHDRRGHGRSSQVPDGHDLDHYVDDLAAVTAHLDLTNAIPVGHSTGGGEVVRYLARHSDKSIVKAAIISAVPPLMLKTAVNPKGLPKEVFDDLQAQLAANRSEFYRALPEGPFYGFNRPGAKKSEAIIANWWRQGMMGGAKAHYDGIVAFSQTDFTEDLTVEALMTWLTVAGITTGPVFRPIAKGGRIQDNRLTDRSVSQIIKIHAARVGLESTEFSGHSLRSGFLTSAAARGASIFRMADQSRHKSMDVLRGYVRNAEIFRDHAGAGLL